MDNICFTSSPNWYCSKVVDCSKDGLFAFGSKKSVVLLRWMQDIAGIESRGRPQFCGILNYDCSTKDRVNGVAFCNMPNEAMTLLASVGDDLTVYVVDITSKTLVFGHREHKAKIMAVTWSCINGLTNCVVSGDESGVLISANMSSAKVKRYVFAKEAITAVCACPNATHIVSIGYQGGLINLADLRHDGVVLHSLRHHDADIQSLCWAPFTGSSFWKRDISACHGDDDHLLASGSKDRTVRIWSSVNGVLLQTFHLPLNLAAGRRKPPDSYKAGAWVTVHWPRSKPSVVLSSSIFGELISWNLNNTDKQPWSIVGHKEGKGHSRAIFNIVSHENVVCTVSMDRQIIFWDLASDVSCPWLLSMPTFVGFAYCLTFSPVNPGYLAIGSGDNMIRTWNTTSASSYFDVKCFWQGIKSKVTTLAWHPHKEGILGFGTDEGRVGIYNVLTNKLPSVSVTYHKKIVYTVSWGPFCPIEGASAGQASELYVYSCGGDGIILVHNPKNMEKPAVNFDKSVQASPKSKKSSRRCEVSFLPDLTILATGNEDGTVELYDTASFKLLVVVTARRKLIHSLRWHPEYTLSSTECSKCNQWLAVASRDLSIQVHDMSEQLRNPSADGELPRLMNIPKFELTGHTLSVASLAWNPHLDGQLVSASFDKTVRVWNVLTMETMACYSDHVGRVLCVEWNPLDPDVIISGGEDSTVRMWRISKQDRGPKCKDALISFKEKAVLVSPNESASPNDVMQNLQLLLEQRKQEILAGAVRASEADYSGVASGHAMAANGALREAEQKDAADDDSPSPPETKTAALSQNGESAIHSELPMKSWEEAAVLVGKGGKALDEKPKKKKKRAYRSMFPLTNSMESCGKATLLSDCMALARKLAGEVDEEVQFGTGRHACLGAFAGRVDAYRLLKTEADNHARCGNHDFAMLLDVWKGNITEVLRNAAKKERLTDWLLAMAPLVSHTLWEEMCVVYSKQLVSENQPHKAVAFLLAGQKVYEAIDVLKKCVSYKEAIVLAKLRLPAVDPLIAELSEEWALHLQAEGKAEQAAKCYLSVGQPEKAVAVLSQRQNPGALRVVAYILQKLGDAKQASVYASLAVYESLAEQDTNMAELLVQENPDLKTFRLVFVVHLLLNTSYFQCMSRDVSSASGSDACDSATGDSLMKMIEDKWEDLGYSQLLEGKEFVDACIECFSQSIYPVYPLKPPVIIGLLFRLIAYLSLKVTLIVIFRKKGMVEEALKTMLSTVVMLHKVSNHKVLRWFFEKLPLYTDPVALSKPPNGGIDSPEGDLTEFSGHQSVMTNVHCIAAYHNFVRLETLLKEERQWAEFRRHSGEQEADTDCCATATDLVAGLLNDEHAEIARLKLRLENVKVAVATLNAKQRLSAIADGTRTAASRDGPPQSEDPKCTGEDVALASVQLEVDVSSLSADEFLDHPQVDAPRLEAEMNRVLERLADFGDSAEASFPDPHNSCLFLAEYCLLLYNRHKRPEFVELLRKVVDFGTQHAALEKQKQCLSEILERLLS